jgi:hypothetical protein
MVRAALPSDAAVVLLRRDAPAATAAAFQSALAPKPQ